MTFKELHLAMAIRLLGRNLSDTASREDVCDFVRDLLPHWSDITHDIAFPFTSDDVRRVAISFVRKPQKEDKVKLEVALWNGAKCFWEHRNVGPCCNDAECGHLVQRFRGAPKSVPNCVIECRTHNRDRKKMTIEEYLLYKNAVILEQQTV